MPWMPMHLHGRDYWLAGYEQLTTTLSPIFTLVWMPLIILILSVSYCALKYVCGQRRFTISQEYNLKGGKELCPHDSESLYPAILFCNT